MSALCHYFLGSCFSVVVARLKMCEFCFRLTQMRLYQMTKLWNLEKKTTLNLFWSHSVTKTKILHRCMNYG